MGLWSTTPKVVVHETPVVSPADVREEGVGEVRGRRVSSMDSRDVRQGRATPDGFCRVRLNTKRRARACRTEPEKGSDARLRGSWCRGEGITATSPLVMMSGRVAATSPLWMCDGATATWSVKTQLIISLMYWGPVQTKTHVFLRSWT